ncbi:hypothetical protein [Synechococcus phage S-M1]|uniref:Uncharacterized protein n=1 Tax=Synechococcus phage QB2 TaxID=3159453 RepID=A0AAU8EIA9_9CAUD|nr:hypothetical protein [Synechococcus phage S-M1]
MTIATAGTGGFGGDAAAEGPNAGYDPVMKFRKKLKDKKKEKRGYHVMPDGTMMPGEVHESRENPNQPSRLFQYKVTVPEIGETILYANSPAELAQKMRILVNPRYRGDIKIERILPGEAGKFFMDKRMKHMRNVKEQADQQMQAQMTRQQINLEKQKADDKIKQIRMELQKKTQALMKKQRAGGAQATVDK